MDFRPIDLDDKTLAFWTEVRAFLDEHVTESVFDEEHRTGDGENFAITRKMGDRGWLYPTWPKEEGGAGLTHLQASILQREISDRFLPMITSGTTQLVVEAVKQWTPEPLRSQVLRGVTRGEIFLSLGYTEPDCGSDLANVKTRAERDGEEWVLNGQKIFSTGAHNCDYAFLLARTNPDVAKHKGLTMFLVPLKAKGVEIQPIHTLGGERTNTVFYDNVRFPDIHRMGPVDDGWNVLNGPLAAEHGRTEEELANEAGLGYAFGRHTRAALEVAVAWANTPGIDGRKPIDDPHVRRRLARVAVDVEVSFLTNGPMGRILASELLIRDSADLCDLVGPQALIARHGEGAIANGRLDAAHRMAQGTATYGGTVEVHRNIVAEHFLGLPRSRPSSSMMKR